MKSTFLLCVKIFIYTTLLVKYSLGQTSLGDKAINLIECDPYVITNARVNMDSSSYRAMRFDIKFI